MIKDQVKDDCHNKSCNYIIYRVLFNEHSGKNYRNPDKIADSLSYFVKSPTVMNCDHGSDGIIDMNTWPEIGRSIMAIYHCHQAGEEIIPWKLYRP